MGCGSSKNKKVKASSIQICKDRWNEGKDFNILEKSDHSAQIEHNWDFSTEYLPLQTEKYNASEDTSFIQSKKKNKNASVKSSRTSLHKIKTLHAKKSPSCLQRNAKNVKKFKVKKGSKQHIVSLRNDDCWIIHGKNSSAHWTDTNARSTGKRMSQ